MPFEIRPIREFLVRPALPEKLSRMSELAYNIFWSWDVTIRSLFRVLDSKLWTASGHNPVRMLSEVPQAKLEEAAADPRYLALYRRACERYDDYMKPGDSFALNMQIAYFSMEYGLVQCMPIYSGGLGVLAGDHCKAASDMALPFVAVGLFYRRGYFRQNIDADGHQEHGDRKSVV